MKSNTKFGKHLKTVLKHQICLLLCLSIVLFSGVSAFADSKNSKNNQNGNSYHFNDVKGDFWAYNQIMWMVERKIITGVGNDNFNPNGQVTRGEFAKLLVLTLNLDLYKPDTASFNDVAKKDWAYPYVETAKKYLTGYRSSNGDSFRPNQAAQREDMAVALVKALGFGNETADESLLNKFSDAAQISPNLRKYVALAVKHELIQGSQKDGGWVFNPLGNLTRAEAATLMYNAFTKNEDKVTYDEDKVTYDDDLYIKPYLKISETDGKLKLSWTGISSNKFQGYRVVISKNDSTPQYPENGYLYYITDKNQTSVTIDNSTAYNATSDFGQYLTSGQSYYFSITAVYSDNSITSNVVRKTYNGNNNSSANVKPVFSVATENGKLVVRWNKINSTEFQSYRVVVSKNDSTPKYPDNGYLYNITDRNTTSVTVDNGTAYSGGDFGSYLTPGEKYYFNVTAVYNNEKISGDAVQFIYPGDDASLYPAPTAAISVEGGNPVLRWTRVDSSKFKSYRVVISKNDSTPQYPDNGYLYTYTNKDRTYAVIDNNTAYTSGDFGKYLVSGQKYYFNVTAVYDGKNVASNTIEYTYNGQNNTDVYQKPVVTVDNVSGNPVVRWNKIDNVKFKSYRIIVSKYDSTPQYPAQGYLYEITDNNVTYKTIDNSAAYTNGDFGKYLNNGEKYYISVTAEYTDRTVAGNAVQIVYNGNANPEVYASPVASVTDTNGVQTLTWNKIDSAKFVGYRIVASKNSNDPKYPGSGYLPLVENNATTSLALNSSTEFTNADFGKYLINGETYNFRVIALYTDKSVEGNVVQFKFNGADNPALFQKPVVTASAINGKLVISWNKIDSAQLVEYRVTVSQNKAVPTYPADGYYKGAFDKNTTSAAIDTPTALTNSDITDGTLKKDVEYYFTVTAVYNYGKYVTSDAIIAKYTE